MKKNTMLRSALSLSLTAAFCLSIAACGSAETLSPSSGALPVKALSPKQVDENPYMAKSDANIHPVSYTHLAFKPSISF